MGRELKLVVHTQQLSSARSTMNINLSRCFVCVWSDR